MEFRAGWPDGRRTDGRTDGRKFSQKSKKGTKNSNLPIQMPYFDAQNQAILKFRGGPILESQKFQFHHLNMYFFDPQNRV